MESTDTGAVKGTANYWNRRAQCGCRSVPDGQHIPPCGQCQTPEATRCRRCGFRTATETIEGREHCGRCGLPK